MDIVLAYCHTVKIVRFFYFHFWSRKMENGFVREFRGTLKLNGVDTQVAFANFREIRRLYITQTGKFSLLLRSTCGPPPTSYEIPVIDVQTVFGCSNILFDTAAKHLMAHLKLTDKPLLTSFGMSKISYADVQTLTSYIASKLLPGIDEFSSRRGDEN
ncbi:hypothetical protein T03_8873 [Trichinella britovi]|uniref:Uncharacterized protein n=1 Tax=Trichinella britovi TaxID=45882 RepID=A0A0V1CUJ2_TRIBR|nr:hypothetical protein T03_8873 [Trichinella britovi]